LVAQFLNITHEQIVARVPRAAQTQRLSSGVLPKVCGLTKRNAIWNAFAEKIGWRDRVAATIEEVRNQSGRSDIATVFDCIDAGEGRLAT
jgi:hypothetical protein